MSNQSQNVAAPALQESSLIEIIRNNKPLLTPARHVLAVPSQSLADAIHAEWAALADEAKPQPASLPLTGFVALTLDVVVSQRETVTQELLEYGETDLLCYRDHSSNETSNAREMSLRERQHQEWQPWLDQTQTRLGTQYEVGEGIVPVVQPSRNSQCH